MSDASVALQTTRINSLINDALAKSDTGKPDHKVTKSEYNEILAQIKVGWVSGDEVSAANAVAAQAEADADKAAGGIVGALARELLEAIMNGDGELSGVNASITKAVDALGRRDAARSLRTDLSTDRAGQGWLAKKAADWLPEKGADWVKNLF